MLLHHMQCLSASGAHDGHWMQVLPPVAYAHQPATNFNTRFVHVSLNKVHASRGLASQLNLLQAITCFIPVHINLILGTNSMSVDAPQHLRHHEAQYTDVALVIADAHICQFLSLDT